MLKFTSIPKDNLLNSSSTVIILMRLPSSREIYSPDMIAEHIFVFTGFLPLKPKAFIDAIDSFMVSVDAVLIWKFLKNTK